LKKALGSKIQEKSLEVNNIQETMTRTMTTMNNYGQIAGQLENAAGTAFGGYFTNKKATQDAVIELQRTSNSQANNAVSNSLQQLAKEYDAAVQEIAILKQIQDSSQVR
jgi:cobyric acid synthase